MEKWLDAVENWLDAVENWLDAGENFMYQGSIISYKGSKPEILFGIAQTNTALSRLKVKGTRTSYLLLK